MASIGDINKMRIPRKKDLFEEIRLHLSKQGFYIAKQELDPLWGGSVLVEEEQAEEFMREYFKKSTLTDQRLVHPVRPKFIVVAPGQAIDWQYHHRRAEWWRVVVGEVGVKINQSDEEPEIQIQKPGDFILLEAETRHRLVGLENWAIIAQVWQHIDVKNLSDDADVVRMVKQALG